MMHEVRTALVGHTGFVGGNLLRQHAFDETFNSRNIEQIAGRQFDLVVCCGAPAEKWRANTEPEQDRANIDRLTSALAGSTTKQLVLISTVDVFRNPIEVDEEMVPSTAGLHAYGANRLRLEQAVAERFDTTILRLPGLYGPGLKKNVIHDLLHDHEIHKIDSRGIFRFYDVERLWSDVGIAMRARVALVHLPTEPVSVADVARVGFGREFTNVLAQHPVRYDVRTRHAALFGGEGAYVETAADELARIAAFVANER